MNCYNFKLNISAYIEGDLKLVQRKAFSSHKESCRKCEQELINIINLLDSLSNLNEISTSNTFDEKLNNKILEIENKGLSIWEYLLNLQPFGFNPSVAFGIGLSIIMIFGTSYLLIFQDMLPDIDINKIANKSMLKSPPNFKPSVKKLGQTLPNVADSDTMENKNHQFNNKRIQLVGGK